VDEVVEVQPDILFQSAFLMIQAMNHLHDSIKRSLPMTVTDLVMNEILMHIREAYRSLSDEEKDVLSGFVKSDKPITLLTTRLSAHQQSELIDAILKEGSYTNSKIPPYLRVTLVGISSSQKLYSSFWSPKPKISAVTPRTVDHHRKLKPIKVAVYRPEDRFIDRPRRPGGVHVGPPRKPLKVEIYNNSIFNQFNTYIRSILTNVI
jgi:hypothetical protein